MNSRFDSIAENPVREASFYRLVGQALNVEPSPYHSMVGGKARQANHYK